MRYSYRRDFTPAFPSLTVTLRNQDLALSVENVEALVDTGADATLIPVAQLREIAAFEVIESSVTSHWGDVRAVRLYLIDLEVGTHLLPSVIVVGDEYGKDVILGRDVLNKLRLLLDGPNKEAQLR